jgi:hypothetical protein
MKYQSHSATSQLAALKIEPSADTLRAAVYSWIVGTGTHGSTDEETSRALDMGGNTERPRRVELVDGGHVVDSGARRRTASNRWAVVWIAARFARPADAERSQPSLF